MGAQAHIHMQREKQTQIVQKELNGIQFERITPTARKQRVNFQRQWQLWSYFTSQKIKILKEINYN